MKKQVLSFILAALAALTLGAPAMAYAGPEAAAYVSADSPETAAVKNGWVTSGGKRYYYINGVKLTGLRPVGGKTYYFSTKDGHMMKSGWVTVNGRKYYLAKDGHALKNGWVTVNGKKYYLAKDGHMLKNGWVTVGSRKYYLAKDGHMMKNGWVTHGSKRYYLAKDGHMLKGGWLTVGSSKYYLAADGHMMKNGLIKVNGKLYYLNAKGVMLKNQTVTVNGQTYTLDAKGVATLKNATVKVGAYVADDGSVLIIEEVNGNQITYWPALHVKETGTLVGNKITFRGGYMTITGDTIVRYLEGYGSTTYKYFGSSEKYWAHRAFKLLVYSDQYKYGWLVRSGSNSKYIRFAPNGTYLFYRVNTDTKAVWDRHSGTYYMGTDNRLYIDKSPYEISASHSGLTVDLTAVGNPSVDYSGSYSLESVDYLWLK